MKRNCINRFWFGLNRLSKYTVLDTESVTIEEKKNENSNIMRLIILPSAATLRKLIR